MHARRYWHYFGFHGAHAAKLVWALPSCSRQACAKQAIMLMWQNSSQHRHKDGCVYSLHCQLTSSMSAAVAREASYCPAAPCVHARRDHGRTDYDASFTGNSHKHILQAASGGDKKAGAVLVRHAAVSGPRTTIDAVKPTCALSSLVNVWTEGGHPAACMSVSTACAASKLPARVPPGRASESLCTFQM